MKKGKVYIVGAGPGPADLLTVRAVEAIKKADVILFDALVSRDVARLFPKNAERLFVGKRAGDGRDVTRRQNSIHQKLKNISLSGRIAVRVKSGDPMIFSRGAEETSFLKENEIPYEVIPGISAFNAAASEYGVPLTDRRGSNSLHLLSGRDVAGRLINTNHLSAILRNRGTAAIYMGSKVLDEISGGLESNEQNEIYATIVSRSGHKDSSVLRGSLKEVVKKHSEKPVKTPALIFLNRNNGLNSY